MGLTVTLYTIAVVCAALCGFLSPAPYLGFAALAAGIGWAAYDLAPVKEPPSAREAGVPPPSRRYP